MSGDRRLTHSLVGACAIALAGSFLLACGELAGSIFVSWGHLPYFPGGLLLASLGKIAVTYVLFGLPLTIVFAAIHWLTFRRRTSFRPRLAAACFFALLAAGVVAPADLAMTGSKNASNLSIAGIAFVLAAYAIGRRLGERFACERWARVSRFGLALIAVAMVVAGFSFVRSPLFDPGGFRLPEGEFEPSSRAQPSVLWIVMDTTRADRLGLLGFQRDTTPFLDEWATRSIVFERAISDGSWTVPAHASMFTGLSAREHGANYHRPKLDPEFTTLAERLGEAGYETVAISNNPWLAGRSNITQGFELVLAAHHLRRLTRFSIEYLLETQGVAPFLPWLDLDYGAAITNELAAGWLSEHANQGPPVFLFVNYMEAHLPYRSPERYQRLFASREEIRRLRGFGAKTALSHAFHTRFNREGRGDWSDSDLEIMRRAYEAGIRYLDDRVGELIRRFEQSYGRSNSIVVVTSDHGEHLDTHDMWSHGNLLYQDLIHVALILREPGRRSGARVETPVQLSDLYQTILNATLEEPREAPGHASRDLIRMAVEEATPRIVVSEFAGRREKGRKRAFEHGDEVQKHRVLPQLAAYDGQYKYLESSDGVRELYHMGRDPGELHNLVDSEPEQAERLAAHLREWSARVPPRRAADPEEALELDPQTEQNLRALGYLGDESP